MIVKQIWTANAYRNFNYLIACSETGEALAVDPLDHEKCLKAAKEEGWKITQILNTHEHRDHTGGNEAVARKTGAKILAHKNAKDTIADMARGLGAGDVVKVGKTVELEVLDTPGHTMCHVCLLSHTDQPALFCGDTLFNAGAGNCHNGGHPDELYKTFDRAACQAAAIDADLSGPRLHRKQSAFHVGSRARQQERPGDARQARGARPQQAPTYRRSKSKARSTRSFA